MCFFFECFLSLEKKEVVYIYLIIEMLEGIGIIIFYLKLDGDV